MTSVQAPIRASWPPLRKTRRQLEIEQEYGGDIRDIILTRLAASRIDANVARDLKLHSATISYWITRLGIEEEAAAARGHRGGVS